MKTKVCPKCGENKSLDAFAYAQRYKDKRQSHCRTCNNAAGIKNYHENKDRYYAKARKRDRWIKEKIRKLKSVPCAECGGTFDPVCMDFDHLPEFDKVQDISKMKKRRMAWATIEAEIAKCEVVCANCHRLRTKDRLEVI